MESPGAKFRSTQSVDRGQTERTNLFRIKVGAWRVAQGSSRRRPGQVETRRLLLGFAADDGDRAGGGERHWARAIRRRPGKGRNDPSLPIVMDLGLIDDDGGRSGRGVFVLRGRTIHHQERLVGGWWRQPVWRRRNLLLRVDVDRCRRY